MHFFSNLNKSSFLGTKVPDYLANMSHHQLQTKLKEAIKTEHDAEERVRNADKALKEIDSRKNPMGAKAAARHYNAAIKARGNAVIHRQQVERALRTKHPDNSSEANVAGFFKKAKPAKANIEKAEMRRAFTADQLAKGIAKLGAAGGAKLQIAKAFAYILADLDPGFDRMGFFHVAGVHVNESNTVEAAKKAPTSKWVARSEKLVENEKARLEKAKAQLAKDPTNKKLKALVASLKNYLKGSKKMLREDRNEAKKASKKK